MQMDHLCDDRMGRTTVLEELDKPLPGIISFYDNIVDEIRNERIDRVRITAQTLMKTIDGSILNEERQKGFVRVRELARKFLMQGHKTSPAFNKWRAQILDFVRELGEEDALSKQLKLLQASLETPLHVIRVFGLASVIEAHYKHLDFNQRSVHGQTALCLAVENNQLETVKALLTHGWCGANEFNVNAWRANTGVLCKLQATCYAGNEMTVEFLLAECNADVNIQGGYHGNALQTAAARGNLQIVELLLEAGASETASGGHFDSALMAATCAGSKEIIE
ncbi:MAG: hypothetical protein Q9210_004509 [Variospora velana]